MLLHLGCTVNERSIPFGYVHLLVLLYFLESSLSEEVDGVGDK